jgi:hypothetical protein
VLALAALAPFNTSGEWFAVEPEDAIAAVHAALKECGVSHRNKDS